MEDSTIQGYIKKAFDEQHVNSEQLVFAIHTDMIKEGVGGDVYTAVDQDNLYILFGEEKIVKTSGAKRIVAKYDVFDLKTIRLEALPELKTERLLSTGRLFSEDEEKCDIILTFSVGFLGDVERLIKVVKNIKEKRAPLFEIAINDELFCPKCGTRYPEPERKLCPKCLEKSSITKRLFGFFGNYRKKVFAVMAIMLLNAGFSIISPYFGSKLFIDDVITKGSDGTGGRFFGAVGAFVLLIFGVRLISTLLGILFSWILAKTVPWIIYDIKTKIFEAMQRLSVGFYTSKRTGNLMNRVERDANNVYWFFVDGLPYVIVNVLTFAGVILMMFLLSAKLTIISIIALPIVIICFRFLWSVFHKLHHKEWAYNSQLNSMVSDSVHGQRVIKANAREDVEAARFAEISGKKKGIDIQNMNIGFTAFPIIYLLLFVGQVAMTAVGGIMVLRDEITIGTLVTFNAYLTMLYGPLEFMSWVSNWWARCVDSSQRMFEIMDAKPDVVDSENPAQLDEIKGNIEIKGVSFEYEPAMPILKGLNLSVEAGKMLGIVGKTGAGKSTLANLIARLYDVTEGEIFIDGVNIKNIPLSQLRKSIGIVSQDIYLFIGSIADNIRYADPKAGIDDVIRAAKAATAHEFIMNLPDGYETRVGAGGQDLSGGEKQRLSIARTILQNPSILILDEATAAMDTKTEAGIQEALSKMQQNRTTISIAHRLSTLRDADNLAVISEGKVVESGTHKELMIKKGDYHKLYSIQLEGLKVINMEA